MWVREKVTPKHYLIEMRNLNASLQNYVHWILKMKHSKQLLYQVTSSVCCV